MEHNSARAAAVKLLKPLQRYARVYENRGEDICQAHGVISTTDKITDFICRCLNKFLELIHIVFPRNIKSVTCSNSNKLGTVKGARKRI
jgi:hypothetical protein